MQWEFVPSSSVLLHPNNKQAERHSHSQVGGVELLTKQGMQQVALGISFCPIRTAYGSKTSLESIWGNFSPLCPLCLTCSHCCCPSFMQKEACWAQGQYSLFELHLCTPSAVNAKRHLHLLLLPYDTAQVWTLTGMSCLSKYFDRMVSLTGFYHPIEMFFCLSWALCWSSYTDSWEKNRAEPCRDEPFVGCLLPDFPYYLGSTTQGDYFVRCSWRAKMSEMWQWHV